MLLRRLITKEKEKLTIVGFAIVVYDKIRNLILLKYTGILKKILVIIVDIKASFQKVL
jgi:hypothetical protein